MAKFQPLAVGRIKTHAGSHIEPPLDEKWAGLTKLRWHAGVILADTRVRVVISTAPHGYYGITIGNSSWSTARYAETWAFLNGVAAGATAPKEVA